MRNQSIMMMTLAAGLAFTACSSEEPTTNGGNNGGLAPGETGYVAIQINTPAENGTRSANEPGYVDGTPAESQVTDGIFFFFGADGAMLQAVTTPITGDWEDGNGGTVDKQKKVVVKITGTSVNPASVIAVLNPTTDLKTNASGLADVTAVRKAVINQKNTAAGTFMMSNSAYSITDGNVYATSLTGTSFFDSESAANAATAGLVDIYVERLVAKADVSVAKSLSFSNNSVNFKGDNSSTTITPVIKGYAIVSTTPSAYNVKDIEGLSSLTWSWNNATNHRSHWGNTDENLAVKNLSWNAISAANTTGSFSEYLFPNTLDSDPKKINNTKATKVIVAAELQVNGKAISPVRYAGVYYKDQAAFLTQVADELKHVLVRYEYTDGEGKHTGTYNPADLKVVRVKVDGDKNHPYRISFKIKDSVLAAKPFAPGAEAKFNAYMANFKPAMEWVDGKTYFYAHIEHKGFAGLDKLNGVVRNHIYKITLDGLNKLGTPVFDPSEEIDPERPTDDPDTYIAARMHIMKWRVVENNLTLE